MTINAYKNVGNDHFLRRNIVKLKKNEYYTIIIIERFKEWKKYILLSMPERPGRSFIFITIQNNECLKKL